MILLPPEPGAGQARPAGVARFRPGGQDDLAPSGAVSRVRANLAALSVLRTVQQQGRPATPAEQEVLARWSGWGAVPEVFDDRRAEYAWAREQLAVLLSAAELAAARRNTLNAHYTDAAFVQAMWEAVQALGFDGGRVLEPGCGSGNFIALRPRRRPGDRDRAGPGDGRHRGRCCTRMRRSAPSRSPTAATPTAAMTWRSGTCRSGTWCCTTAATTRPGTSIHNHFIIKALRLVRPGGLVAVLTSRYTMDARNPAARREIASLADLVGAIRLPGGAHQRAAGTSVVTDLLVLRRREPGRQPDADCLGADPARRAGRRPGAGQRVLPGPPGDGPRPDGRRPRRLPGR